MLVELKDGRVQEIVISNLDGDTKKMRVSVKETVDGKIVRQECTEH
ncbi:hypothetical protein [Saccharicrinis fermentans]|nr:hypothetical protein [Saccharicrinis fermentans]